MNEMAKKQKVKKKKQGQVSFQMLWTDSRNIMKKNRKKRKQEGEHLAENGKRNLSFVLACVLI